MLTLIADPDRDYAETVSMILRREDHQTSIVRTHHEVSDFLSTTCPDLVVMSSSAKSPGMGVLESFPAIVSRLRQQHHVPVIVLVEHMTPNDIAALLDAGAGDCIRKPFHPTEFAARIRAVIRQGLTTLPGTEDGSLPRSGDGLLIDDAGRRAYLRGVDLHLSDLEFDILLALKDASGEVLTYQALNERVWGYPHLLDGTLLRGHVSAIRKKVVASGFQKRLIRTVYGVGYALA